MTDDFGIITSIQQLNRLEGKPYYEYSDLAQDYMKSETSLQEALDALLQDPDSDVRDINELRIGINIAQQQLQALSKNERKNPNVFIPEELTMDATDSDMSQSPS